VLDSIFDPVKGEAAMTNKHVETLEKQITALSDALAHLGRGTTGAELLKIIHKPGWTTLAEFAFLAAMLKTTQMHVSAIEALQADMLAASKAVGEQR
jgi:hypothetical protein